MPLTRKWMPTSNFYAGRSGTARLIVLHTTEGAQTIESLGSFFATGTNQASSHTGSDNKSSSIIGEYVKQANTAWTCANANSVSVNIEQCTPSGAASNWKRDYWLNSQSTMLAATAAWVAETAKAFGIPVVALTSSQAQGGSKGICQHSNLGAWGGGHHDCGPGYPMDMIIQWAKGNKPGPSPATGDQMSTAVAYYQGKIHQAGIWKDHKVNYKPPGGKWYAVDVKSYASTGATIAIDPATGNMCISYTNKDGSACTYEKGPAGTAWRWTNQGGTMLV